MLPPFTASFPSYQPPKASKRTLTLFERGWSNFPLGGVPLDLLLRVSRRLVAFHAFQRSLGLPLASPAERRALHAELESRSGSYYLDYLQSCWNRELENIVFKEVSTLLLLLLVAPPWRADPSLHRQALFATMRRLGQVYQECKRRWSAPEAQALLLEQVERLCQAWLRGDMLRLLADPLRSALAWEERNTAKKRKGRR